MRRRSKNPKNSKKRPAVRKKKALKRPQKPLKRVIRKAKRLLRVPLQTLIREPKLDAVSPAVYSDDRIPPHYGDNKLALMVRDPWWLFAYWEISDQRRDEVSHEIVRHGHKIKKTVLRVYDVTKTSLPKYNSFFDIELNFYSDNWYIDVGLPDKEWVAEIGYRTEGGRFYVLARSNKVRTPAFGLSEVLDEEWMLPEDVYYRLIGRTFGVGSHEGSMDIRKLLEKYLRNIMSSERAPNIKTGQAVVARLVSD